MPKNRLNENEGKLRKKKNEKERKLMKELQRMK